MGGHTGKRACIVVVLLPCEKQRNRMVTWQEILWVGGRAQRLVGKCACSTASREGECVYDTVGRWTQAIFCLGASKHHLTAHSCAGEVGEHTPEQRTLILRAWQERGQV